MEALGAEGQWTSLSGVYTAEEADFMANLLLNNNQISSMTFQNFWPDHHHQQQSTILNTIDHYYHMPTNYCSLELSNPNNSNNNNMFSSTFSRGSTSPSNTTNHSSFNVFPTSSNDLSDQNSQPIASIDFFVGATKNKTNNNCDDQLSSEDISDAAPKKIKESSEISTKSSGKRSRSFENVEVVLGKRNTNTKPKKKPKLVLSIPGRGNIGKKEEEVDEEAEAEEEESKGLGANNVLSSSSGCWSVDDNGGQESPDSSSLLTPKQPNSEAKARARRGSATDPQSLYARKRRERINERLKVLQNLVPNGTKVDISTMLEEAVQYVKFLQHQIKLLSSDDLWMYAPIAYNGKEVGLDHNLKLRLANLP